MSSGPWRVVICAVATCVLAASALAVEVGEKAPEIDVSEWVQGEPVKLADDAGKKVWLVVSWRTFQEDGASPLTAIDKIWQKNKDAGFDVVAITTEPSDVVRTFLAENKVGFRVAVDQFHKTDDLYTKGVKKLPLACLVDKTGTVVWKGEPPARLDQFVPDVIAGKFDLKRAQDVASRQQELWKALFKRDWDGIAAAADKILAVEPGDTMAFSFRMIVFQQKNDPKAFLAFMKAHVDRCKDDAEALRRAALQLARDGGFAWRDVDLAVAAVRRAVEVTKSGNADVLDAHAQVLFTIGLLDQAVAESKKAVALEPKDDDHKKKLAYFEACVAARKKATSPTPPPKKK